MVAPQRHRHFGLVEVDRDLTEMLVAVGGGASVAGAGMTGVLAGVTVPDGIASLTRRVIGG